MQSLLAYLPAPSLTAATHCLTRRITAAALVILVRTSTAPPPHEHSHELQITISLMLMLMLTQLVISPLFTDQFAYLYPLGHLLYSRDQSSAICYSTASRQQSLLVLHSYIHSCQLFKKQLCSYCQGVLHFSQGSYIKQFIFFSI